MKRPCGHPRNNPYRHSPAWNSYRAAQQRCRNRYHGSYEWYGAQGVEFRFCCIHAWVAILGPRPHPGWTVDRRDPGGHYEPGNVRWASPETQAANKRARPYHAERQIARQHAAYAEHEGWDDAPA